jgi:hypothetical protein
LSAELDHAFRRHGKEAAEVVDDERLAAFLAEMSDEALPRGHLSYGAIGGCLAW